MNSSKSLAYDRDKMTKEEAIGYVNSLGYSFHDLIGLSVDDSGDFLVMHGGNSSHHIVFDDDFSDWCISNSNSIENGNFIYAKVGHIEHKKFNRDIGMLFFFDDKDNKIKSYCLVQNIKNRLHLRTLD